MLNESVKENIKKTFHHSLASKEVLSASDILSIKKLGLTNWNKTRSYPGGKIIFSFFENQEIKKYFLDLFKNLYPKGIPGINYPWEEVTIAGNLYITPSEYGLHTDSFSKDDLKFGLVVIKNIIIPLEVCGNNIDHPYINNFILMKNRVIDYESNFQKNSPKLFHCVHQDMVSEYNEIKWYDDRGNILLVDPDRCYISKEDLENHLSHIKEKSTLDGFIIESIFKFNVGDIIIHDGCQAHMTGHLNYKPKIHITNKMGIRLALMIPLDALNKNNISNS
jgi:hypothetical protein